MALPPSARCSYREIGNASFPWGGRIIPRGLGARAGRKRRKHPLTLPGTGIILLRVAARAGRRRRRFVRLVWPWSVIGAWLCVCVAVRSPPRAGRPPRAWNRARSGLVGNSPISIFGAQKKRLIALGCPRIVLTCSSTTGRASGDPGKLRVGVHRGR